MQNFKYENSSREELWGSVRARIREIHPLVPQAGDALVPVQVDGLKVCHYHEPKAKNIVAACILGPTSRAEHTLHDLLHGSRSCGKCIPEALGSSSLLAVQYREKTRLLAALAKDEFASKLERMRTIVEFIWKGNNNGLPSGEYRRLVDELFMPELKMFTATGCKQETFAGPCTLVALTARDIHMGFEDNPLMYSYIITAAAQNIFYATKSNSVWLLTVPSWPGLESFPTGQWALGTVLDTSFSPSTMDDAALEIFGTLCNDALAGSAEWSNLRHFYRSATLLSR